MTDTSQARDVLTTSRRREKASPKTIREIRHSRGMTLSGAAREAQLNRARLSELETGVRAPSTDELVALEVLYGRRLRVVLAIAEELR